MTQKINTNLALLLNGQFISQIGDKFYAIALAFRVMESTHSAAAMGTVLFFSLLPSVLTGLLFGSLVDRFNKKAVIITADVLRGLIITGITIAFYFQVLNFQIIIASQIVLSIISAFFSPAVFAVIPKIVKTQDLSKANAKSQLINSLALIIGPVLGGLIVSRFGYTPVFIFNAASFLFSAFLTWFIILPKMEKAAVKQSKKLNPFSGYKAILKNKTLGIIICIVALVHFFVGAFQVVIPVLAIQLNGKGAQNLGFLEAAFGTGSVLAGLLLSLFKPKISNARLLFIGIFSIGFFYTAIGFLRWSGIADVSLFTVLFAALGVSILTSGVNFQVIIQNHSTPETIGSIFSIASSIGNLSIPAAALLTGWLAGKFNVFYTAAGSGLILVLFSTLLLILYPFKEKAVMKALIEEDETTI